MKIPYFFDLGVDKNLTLASNIYLSENPLFTGSYHQAFKILMAILVTRI